MSDRTIVALGCSQTSDYSFLLPITALFWRRVGFEPLAIIVGDHKDSGSLAWSNDPKTKVTFDQLIAHRIPTYSVSAIDGYPIATMAQNVRQHAAGLRIVSDFGNKFDTELVIDENDWVMPADADLWPLRPEFYTQHENSPYRAVSYYWNGDHFVGKTAFLKAIAAGKRTQTIPTCHVAMRAKDWRETYGLNVGENLYDAVKRTLDIWFRTYPADSFNTWMSDQDIMTANLCRQPWFPTGTPPDDGGTHASGDVLFVGRRGHPPVDRLCRSVYESWVAQTFAEGGARLRLADPARWTDAHVFRAPFADDNWMRLLMLIDAYIPEHGTWARGYRNEYVEAGK
ncbi:MAG: hypothetical protein V4550_18300 [Gemmatimonadota bacterium]